MKALSPERENALLTLLREAIETGAAAPSNPVVAERLGFKSISSACYAVKCLEQKGLIEVMRTMNTRVIRMRDQSTAPTKQAAYSRTSAHLQSMTRVYREPCFFCGVRSDLGCKHGVAA